MPDFYVHSGVRKRHTRLKRMQASTHPALVQHIGGLIVRRSRPVRISEAKVAEILPQLQQAHAEGRLELRTPDGRLVDLQSLAPVTAPEVSRPLPNPPLDSAANDKPTGAQLPAYYEGTAISAKTTTPALVAETVADLTDDDAEQEVETDPEASDAPVSTPLTSPATGEVIGPSDPEAPALIRNRKAGQ